VLQPCRLSIAGTRTRSLPCIGCPFSSLVSSHPSIVLSSHRRFWPATPDLWMSRRPSPFPSLALVPLVARTTPNPPPPTPQPPQTTNMRFPSAHARMLCSFPFFSGQGCIPNKLENLIFTAARSLGISQLIDELVFPKSRVGAGTCQFFSFLFPFLPLLVRSRVKKIFPIYPMEGLGFVKSRVTVCRVFYDPHFHHHCKITPERSWLCVDDPASATGIQRSLFLRFWCLVLKRNAAFFFSDVGSSCDLIPPRHELPDLISPKEKALPHECSFPPDRRKTRACGSHRIVSKGSRGTTGPPASVHGVLVKAVFL